MARGYGGPAEAERLRSLHEPVYTLDKVTRAAAHFHNTAEVHSRSFIRRRNVLQGKPMEEGIDAEPERDEDWEDLSGPDNTAGSHQDWDVG